MLKLPVSASGRSAEKVARLCAQEAGRVIMAAFGGRQEVRVKGRGNFVTEADLQAERAVTELLGAEYPDHAVLSEETAQGRVKGQGSGVEEPLTPDPWPLTPEGQGPGWLWVVDPLDGTHNFSRGIPYFAFNVALCQGEEPLLALTYAPATGEEFFAVKGGGLSVHGQPARASGAGSLKECVLGIDLGYEDRRAARLIDLLAELWPGMQSVRVMGSAALGLAYAACGRYDLFVHHFLYPWDIAAGILQVGEGGGAIVDRDGGPAGIRSEGVVAGAPAAVDDFLRLAKGRPWRE